MIPVQIENDDHLYYRYVIATLQMLRFRNLDSCFQDKKSCRIMCADLDTAQSMVEKLKEKNIPSHIVGVET